MKTHPEFSQPIVRSWRPWHGRRPARCGSSRPRYRGRVPAGGCRSTFSHWRVRLNRPALTPPPSLGSPLNSSALVSSKWPVTAISSAGIERERASLEQQQRGILTSSHATSPSVAVGSVNAPSLEQPETAEMRRYRIFDALPKRRCVLGCA